MARGRDGLTFDAEDRIRTSSNLSSAGMGLRRGQARTPQNFGSCVGCPGGRLGTVTSSLLI